MLGDETWQRYFTFTVVRNPYDRCLSRFYYSKKVEEDRGRAKAWDFGDLDQYMRYNPWFINENWAMYTQNDRVLVDFCVRYENLEEDLAEVSRRIGLERNVHEDMRSISAKRGLRPPTQASARLSEAERQMIWLLCAREIEMFGYRPDGAAAEAPGRDSALVPALVSALVSGLVSGFLPVLAALGAAPL